LPPKLPPVVAWATRTRWSGQPSAVATARCTANGEASEPRMTRPPAPSGAASTPSGSRYACSWDGVRYVASTTTRSLRSSPRPAAPERGGARPPPHPPPGRAPARGESRLHVGDGGQRLVGHVDRGETPPERVRVVGRDERHRLPDVPDVLGREHRPVRVEER